MYGFEDYIEISFAQILQKITQEQIFEMVFKQPVNLNILYKNPLRRDRKPSCKFEYHGDILLFIDFGDTVRTHRSCFKMVMDKYKVSSNIAIKIIIDYFNLSSNLSEYKEVEAEIENFQKDSFVKPFTQLNFIHKEFTKQDMKYWSQYLIYPPQLKEDKVFSVDSFQLSSGRIIRPFGLCYAYTFPNKRVKIYRPLVNPKYKWVTNCDNNVIGNIQNISDKGELLIISKSYKDSRVLRNLGIKDVIWFQNEGQIPNDYININLINRFKKIIFFYDNDIAGIEAGVKLSNIYNSYKNNCSKTVHIPKKYKWKDPSDFISKEGRRDLVQVLLEIGVILK